MAIPSINPTLVVAAATAYERDVVNDVYAKRVFIEDELIGAIKVRYLLKALQLPNITVTEKYQIYECLIAFTRLY